MLLRWVSLTYKSLNKNSFLLLFLDNKLKEPPYSKMMIGDVYQCRVSGSVPLIWQFWPGRPQLVCPVPNHFVDCFPVCQEWQQLSNGQGYILRMDYLHYLPLPAGPNIHSVGNLFKLKAALNIDANTNLTREVQTFHVINSIYDMPKRTSILMGLGFFRGSETPLPVHRPLPILRVQLPELTSEMDAMPSSAFSDQALRELQQIRFRKSQRQKITGKSKKKNLGFQRVLYSS